MLAREPADQVDAGGDVAPLVAAADLQRAAVPAVEVQEVVRLQQHVAELGEGDASLAVGAMRARTDSLASIWFDAEVLADVAQEVDERPAARASRRC